MKVIQENELLREMISKKFYSEKLENSQKISDWFIKIIIVFSALRILMIPVDFNIDRVQVFVSASLLVVFIPLLKLSESRPKFKYYIGFVLLWLIEPISNYYSFWVDPKYDILYGMGNTILLYYGILEMAYTFESGVVYIIIHLAIWCVSGYISGHIPIPQVSDTWFTLLSVLFFHILFFKNRFEIQIEGVKNKCIIERKELIINNIVQAIPEGLLVIDFNCNVLLKNRSYDVLVGHSLDLEYIPKLKNLEIMSANNLQQDINYFIKSNLQRVVFGTVNAKGFKLEVTATKIMWETISAIILTFRDVSELIRLEKEVVESTSVLQTLRGISHELKTPLYVIINKLKSELIRTASEPSENLTVSLQSSRFLLNSVRDIMDYSSIKFGNYFSEHSRSNIVKIINDSVKICCLYHGFDLNNIKVNFLNTFSAFLMIDKRRFKQVLVSILSKSIIISSNKLVNLEVFQDTSKFFIDVSFTSSENTVKSYLNEDESFMSEDSQVKLNEGLIHEMIKTIIKQVSQKDLKISFSLPNFFKFSFEFPFLDDSKMNPVEEVSEEGFKFYPRPSLKMVKDNNSKVLIVDDIPINIQISKSLLHGISVECVGVLSGKEAIELLIEENKNPYKFKVILLDCMMPEMDGWETAIMIHKLYESKELKYLPYIIGYSAIENKQDIQKCFQSGMDDFLAKPSPTGEYYNKISRWLLEPFRLLKT